MKLSSVFFVVIMSVCTTATAAPSFPDLSHMLDPQEEAQMVKERSPARLFINSDGTLTQRLITLLKLDNQYEEGDDLIKAKDKTQACWLSVLQGKGDKERTDLKDSPERATLRPKVEAWIDEIGITAERTPVLKKYNYGIAHGAFLDGVRRNIAQLVAAWVKGIRFDSLVILTGERDLRKVTGDMDCIEKLCDEKLSPLPFKKGWKMPEGAPYETEYDMVRLVLDQMQLPENMEKALAGKIVVVNALKGAANRTSTKVSFQTWLKEYSPKPGTILACSYPLLWVYQQLVGETLLMNSGFALDTIAPALSQKERVLHQERLVSLVFDSVTKCLYELSLTSKSNSSTCLCV